MSTDQLGAIDIPAMIARVRELEAELLAERTITGRTQESRTEANNLAARQRAEIAKLRENAAEHQRAIVELAAEYNRRDAVTVERRLHLGPAAVLSPSAAVELMPFGDGGSRAWLDPTVDLQARTAAEVDGMTFAQWCASVIADAVKGRSWAGPQ